MTSEDYSELLRDARWIEKRDFILRRDGQRCRVCKSEAILHVHHILYGGAPWDVPDDALITLCDQCHEKAHGIQKGIKGMNVSEVMTTSRESNANKAIKDGWKMVAAFKHFDGETECFMWVFHK